MEKLFRKCALKASPRSIFNFGKNPKQPLHARNSFENRIIKKLQKIELYFFFLFKHKTIKNKRRPGTCDQSLLRLRKTFRNILLLVKLCLI